MKNYVLTDNMKLYSKTYWGNAKYLGNMSIIHNRDKLIERYGLKSYVRTDNKQFKKYISNIYSDIGKPYLDHLEIYKTNRNSLIVIVSPYSSGHTETLKYYGLHKLGERIYDIDTDSYLGEFKLI